MVERYRPIYLARTRDDKARAGLGGRFAGGALFTVAFAAVVAWAWPSSSPRRPAVAPAPGLAFAPPAASADAPRSNAAPSSTRTLAPRSAVPTGQVEVCGLGLVAASADDPDGAARIPATARRDAESALLHTLAANPDERVRAAGLLLRLRSLHADPAAAGGADAVVADLAQRAAHSTDATVYATALEACNQQDEPRPAACDVLSANRWAVLEPANAAPWLLLAQQAQAHGDEQGLADAAWRISRAQTIAWHDNDLALLALNAIPSEASPLARTLATRAIVDARDDWATPAYGGLSTWCAPEDANRDQVCNAAADLLVRRGTRVAETKLGARLGQGLGWSPDRIESLRLKRDALSDAQAEAALRDRSYSCATTARIGQQVALQQRLGAFGATRVGMKHSGKSLDDAVDALRQARAQRRVALDSQEGQGPAERSTAGPAMKDRIN